MKTALLLTNSAATQHLLTEILGQNTNFVLLPLPTEPTREKFDALFLTWLRLADAVILDAASLGETSLWAIESLAEAKVEDRQAIVVRATATQQTLYPLAPHWLTISDTDSPEQLKQSLGTFFELRDAQARLKRADAIIARQRQTAPASSRPGSHPMRTLPDTGVGASSSFDLYRYRAALKSVSQLLTDHPDRETLWRELLGIVRDLLGVGKLAIFTRAFHADFLGRQTGSMAQHLSVAASAGIAKDIVKHLCLTMDAGIGGYLANETKILRRAQLLDPLALDFDPQIAREFELLGTEVAMPMFDNDQLVGVLTFSGKITGETLANEELEMAYHLLAQIAQAIHNFDLHSQIASQQRLLSEVLANVQSGVVVAGPDGRVLSLNRRARELLDLAPLSESGQGAEDYVGRPLNRLPSRVADVVFETLQTGREIHQREVMLPHGHHPLGVSVTRFAVTPFPQDAAMEEGNLVAIALIEDLTQVKLQQERVREMADRDFFTRLAARLSHELKNSLVSIKVFAQLLPERYHEKEFREQFSTTVTNEINRVDVLVNNLTFFAHPLLLVCEEVALSDVIETCLKNITQEFNRKHGVHIIGVGDKAPESPQAPVVTVKKSFGHKIARLEGDRIRLMQAFEHVLRNAVQSMPQGGRLTVSTADAQPMDFPDGHLPPGGALRIEWQDSGSGIALGQLKQVTEPFVTMRNVGTGLGLTIVKKIIERHSGQLEIDSHLGRGTTIVILLPLKAQPHPEDNLLNENLKEGMPSNPPGTEDADGGATVSLKVGMQGTGRRTDKPLTEVSGIGPEDVRGKS